MLTQHARSHKNSNHDFDEQPVSTRAAYLEEVFWVRQSSITPVLRVVRG
jgi:hypothetical protein